MLQILDKTFQPHNIDREHLAQNVETALLNEQDKGNHSAIMTVYVRTDGHYDLELNNQQFILDSPNDLAHLGDKFKALKHVSLNIEEAMHNTILSFSF